MLARAVTAYKPAVFTVVLVASLVLPALYSPMSSRAVTDCSPNSIVSGGEAASWLGGNGVNVCSTGSDTDNYVDNVNGVSTLSGEKWECVELVNRLYLTEGWITSHWYGNGNTLINNIPSGLTEQDNGSISYINPGDVITFNYTQNVNGHTAIINTIDSSGELHIINQNGTLNSTATPSGGTSLSAGDAHYTIPWLGFTVQAIVHHPASSSPRLWALASAGQVYYLDASDNLVNIPGTLSKIDSDTTGTLWGLDSSGNVYYSNNGSLVNVAGTLAQISAGDGVVWGLSSAGGTYKWQSGSFVNYTGVLSSIDVQSNGTAWGLDSNGHLYEFNGSSWANITSGVLAKINAT